MAASVGKFTVKLKLTWRAEAQGTSLVASSASPVGAMPPPPSSVGGAIAKFGENGIFSEKMALFGEKMAFSVKKWHFLVKKWHFQ